MEHETDPRRPAPVLTEDNEGFWLAAKDGRLGIQRCGNCRQWSHPPRPMCPTCHSVDRRIETVSGLGEIYSFALLHHPQNPAFSYPVIAVLIDLDEGPRVLSNLIGLPADQVRIGLPVEVAFEPTRHDLSVPVFEPRAEPS